GRETYSGLLAFNMETSIRAALKLDEKIERLIQQLSQFNFSCPPSPKLPRFRRCVVMPDASLLYEIVDNAVYIIAVVDNRADHLYF
ncbi:MAG TPA: hypothetical protein PK228_06260, partial [Saprospiraceae bacterium]|nr:hypothetical protein [Saprospiraceae bacterium]